MNTHRDSQSLTDSGGIAHELCLDGVNDGVVAVEHAADDLFDQPFEVLAPSGAHSAHLLLSVDVGEKALALSAIGGSEASGLSKTGLLVMMQDM